MSEARHIGLDKAALTVTASYESAGSILADTVQQRALGFHTSVELESTGSREEVAALVATAERMCFVLDVIRQPHDVGRSLTLNGEPLT